MNIRMVVMDFSSHRTWAEGYQRWTEKHSDQCQVHLTFISGEKWKFRTLSGAATFMDRIDSQEDFISSNDEDTILLVDGMFDATVIKAHCSGRRYKVLVYFHENQLTTPFSSQDRDQKNNTSWHFGMVHYRSLLVADGFVFNSHTQMRDFQLALPRILKEQCPTDEIDWHLEKCNAFFQSKCAVLHYGLELDELSSLVCTEDENESQGNPRIPTILWNARLEEDKDPGTFVEMLKQVRKDHNSNFRLIVLGTDSTKDQRWYKRFRDEFGNDTLLFMGWCNDRKEYAEYLHKADIVVSTARHETFGISIVESVFCGALPLLPNRLSYPELFPPSTFGTDHLYDQALQDGVPKLANLLQIVSMKQETSKAMQIKAKKAITKFRWASMGPVYDRFWSRIGAGESLESLMMNRSVELSSSQSQNGRNHQTSQDERLIEITEASDPRVQLYRPKSLRDHVLYHEQLDALQMTPILHGGRRAMVRMVEAIQLGAQIQPLSFLTTRALAQYIETTSSPQIPIYTVNNIRLLNEIRGQSINSGDAILSMIHFPIPCPMETIRPPILVLNQVRNAENVGSLLRTAYCLGTIQSVLCGDTTSWAAVRDSRAARCSMGTLYYHKFYRTHDLRTTLLELRQQHGIRVYGIEINERAIPLRPHMILDSDKSNNSSISNKTMTSGDPHSSKWAMVMGNEDTGLSPDVEAVCDKIVYIPQAHGDSLNVGHAAAIAMYELGKASDINPTIVTHDGCGACP